MRCDAVSFFSEFFQINPRERVNAGEETSMIAEADQRFFTGFRLRKNWVSVSANQKYLKARDQG